MSEAQAIAVDSADRAQEPFLRSVGIRNYKSIAACRVALRPLSFLVGRNGSGKSNFLDALRLVVDGLNQSLEHAIQARGGIDAVRRRSTGHPRNLAIELEFNLDARRIAKFGFEIGSKPNGGFVIKSERLQIRGMRNQLLAEYEVAEGTVKSQLESMPPAATDRFYLVNASGRPEFREVYDALLAMGFYSMNPEAMKKLQSPDANELLRHDGGNIASVVGRLRRDREDQWERIKQYLRAIVPGINDVEQARLGAWETLEFRQNVEGARKPWRFQAASMSDGTLRALGTLLAVTQLVGPGNRVRLVGIEEPETALHPAAAGALMDALREAATHTQVIVTSHSPDLLDNIDPANDALLAVQVIQGNTEIGPVDSTSREAIQKHLYTAGELLRMDQLQIEHSQSPQRVLDLFPDE